MNIPTLIVVLIVAGLFALAVRSMVRKGKTGACAGCSEKSCGGGADPQRACTSVARALASVDARLGSLGSAGGNDGCCAGCGTEAHGGTDGKADGKEAAVPDVGKGTGGRLSIG